MSWLRYFRRAKWDEERAREMETHLAIEAEENIARGMPPEEARYAAMRKLGNQTRIREEIYRMNTIGILETLWQDVRYGARMLRRSPGFTAVAILTLALGIGANTAIFSVTYGILLKPLPYPNSSRIVQIWSTTPAPQPSRVVFISTRDFHEIETQNDAFQQVAGYTEGGSTMTGAGGPESVQTTFVSGNFFSVLGARPLLGRPILPTDAEPGHNGVAVLSYELWQRRFGGDPGIVGKKITLAGTQEVGNSLGETANERPYTVIGVMPSRFPFPNRGEIVLPQASWEHQFQAIAIARLKEGISLNQANAELHTIATRIDTESPAKSKGRDLTAGLLRDRMSEGYGMRLLVLLGAVSFVLLLACVNVSSLLIARSWTRQKEMAIRESLGATRTRLLRQFLSESLLLALPSATLGLLLAYWGINLLRAMAPSGTPRLDEIGLSGPILAYTMAVSLLASFLFGLAPAMQITRARPSLALKESGSVLQVMSIAGAELRLRNFLVVTEISLAFVLAIGSTLALRSFSNLTTVNLGYRLDKVLTMWVIFSPSIKANPEAFRLAMNEVLERTRSVPGVEETAFGEWRPLSSSMGSEINMGGNPSSVEAEHQIVSPEYFESLGIPILAGRSFINDDTKDGPPVAVVNETLGKRYLDGKPLGKRLITRDGEGRPIQIEIIGVAGDTRDKRPTQEPSFEFYTPFSQAGHVGETTLFVRTSANPMAIANAIREQVWSVDKNAPIEGLETMATVMAETVAEPRFQTLLLSAFGGLGLLLATIGIYGVISYSVVQRTHEIGVRMALGAQPREIVRLVLAEGMLLAGLGIGIGMGGAMALTRYLQALLFEINPMDPATFLGVVILIAGVALAACYIPARRAMRVDPMVALRYE